MKQLLSTPLDGGTLVVFGMLLTTLGLTVGADWGVGQWVLLVGGVVLCLVAAVRLIGTAAPAEQKGHTNDDSSATPPFEG